MSDEFQGLGRTLIFTGLIVAALGVVVAFHDKIPFLGRLPGDFHFRRDNFSFYFPLASGLLVSLILSLIFWLFRR